MVKGKFWDDTFEQIVELGGSTAKASAKAVTSTFNPVKIVESAAGLHAKAGTEGKKDKKEGEGGKKNNTPLDFDGLQKKYQSQDKVKAEALRNRLFQLVKKGEEDTLVRKKQEEEEKKRKLAFEEEEKKKKLQEKKKAEAQATVPQGKVRKSIFSPKKVAQREQVEVKANSGKQ